MWYDLGYYPGVPVAMAKQTTKESTKTQLLDAGIEIMIEKGYNNTGIMEVLQSTGVPKGSFYYYFDSKEDFGLQIINHFDSFYQKKLHESLGDTTKTPMERLIAYCDSTTQSLQQNACRKGCLIGNLSQEMADQSEVFRQRLQEIMVEWRGQFADCIKQGQDAGEINAEFDSISIAEYFQSGWSGAVMRAKTMKSTEPLSTFTKIFFSTVLNRK
jgi:TetR/AcrR family transcriptional repressor of nem operon